jgi:uncharacterized protein YjbI with pentapeptide repeats
MTRIAIIAAAMTLFGAPVSAQNGGEIARVQSGASCSGCNLFQADLSYRDLPRVNLSGARLRQANLSLTTMNGANFSRADLSVADLFGGRFTGASFAGANLQNANFVGAYFGRADFSGATLNGAIFSGAEMERVRGLTQAQLDTACGDQDTRLPPGLRIPVC